MLVFVTVGLLLALVLINLTGLSVATLRFTRNYALARAASPLFFVLPLFCLEHAFGLGSLAWLWPITTAASAWCIWRARDEVRANWVTEVLFVVGFGYAFFWRFLRPDLDGSSEKLTDLGFIANYLGGTQLPPVDRWLPPFPFNIYYSLQFYAGALVDRIFKLDLGVTYHVAFCIIVGLAVVAAGSAARLLCERKRWWILPTAAFLIGGTGMSPWMEFLIERPLISDSMRFIGGSAVPGRVNTDFGRWVVSASHVPAKDTMELPAETFSYLVYLGDLHPPMAGFYLLALALLAIAIAEREDDDRFAPAFLMATVPLTLAADAWNFPLQFALAAAWIGYRLYQRRAPDWRACAIGAALPAVLLFPFLRGFAFHSLDYGTSLRLVPWDWHTPPLLGLLLGYPLFAVLLMCLIRLRSDKLAVWFAMLCVALLTVSEVFYVDDIYGGKFERFNTTLKWWPWIYSLGLVAVGSLNLASKSAARRRWTALALYIPVLFAADLAVQALRVPSPHTGRLTADAWLMDDPTQKAILEDLRSQPPAIVLQRPARGAFTASPGLTMHAGQTSFLGWPAHERLWRGTRVDITLREHDVRTFYRGELEDAAGWLVQNHIEHILWLKDESEMPIGTFERIQAQIATEYYWREFGRSGDQRVGMWSRRAK